MRQQMLKKSAVMQATVNYNGIAFFCLAEQFFKYYDQFST